MSRIRELAIVVVLACAGACGREADVVLTVERGAHAGGLTLFVCGTAPTDVCKEVQVFEAGDDATSREVGIFVDNGAAALDLQLQQSGGAACHRFTVDTAQASAVGVTLMAAPDAPAVTCTGCGTIAGDCDYPSHPR